MPEAVELLSDLVVGVGTAKDDGAGAVTLAEAAIPFCGGTNM